MYVLFGWVSREATEENIESSGGDLQELKLLVSSVGAGNWT